MGCPNRSGSWLYAASPSTNQWRAGSLGKVLRLRRSQQGPDLHPQSLGKAFHVGERHIPARTLHRRYIRPVEFAFQRQALLRPTFFHTFETHPIRQDITQIVWIGQLGRGLRLGRHPSRMQSCYICIYGVCISIHASKSEICIDPCSEVRGTRYCEISCTFDEMGVARLVRWLGYLNIYPKKFK